MAEIVVLKNWREKHPGKAPIRLQPSSLAQSPAQLVLFMGVRYERLEDLTHRKMDELALSFDKH